MNETRMGRPSLLANIAIQRLKVHRIALVFISSIIGVMFGHMFIGALIGYGIGNILVLIVYYKAFNK